MRKLGIILSLVVFISIVAFISIKIEGKIESKEIAKSKIATLDNFAVVTLDSAAVNIYDLIGHENDVIIALFQTECDHCVYELSEFQKHSHELKNVKTLFLSSEAVEKLRSFKRNREIAEFISVNSISTQDLSANFGSVSWPSIFVYDRNKHLIKNFVGETDVKLILQALQENKPS